MAVSAPVILNITPLNTTCPMMSTSTSSTAASLLFRLADTSRPMALDAAMSRKIVMKISTLVSSSRWFCGIWMISTKPAVKMPACTASTRNRVMALLSTVASSETPTLASRKIISRSLQISR